jgi:TPR repeat protein
MFANGQGLPKDYSEAMKWYRKAADQDNADAQHNLGFIYDNGQGVPQNHAEALKWYHKAADSGHVRSQHILGVIYTYGPSANVRPTATNVAKQKRKNADQDVASGSSHLEDVPVPTNVLKDYAKAMMWYRKAADQSDARAQAAIGVMYRDGLGVPKDDIQARYWMNLAIAQGNSIAKKNRPEVESGDILKYLA